MRLAGEEASPKYKGTLLLARSVSAKVFADIALFPLEMTKVKIQTSPAGAFSVSVCAALVEMNRPKAETRYLSPSGRARYIPSSVTAGRVLDQPARHSRGCRTRWRSSSSSTSSACSTSMSSSRPRRRTARRRSSASPSSSQRAASFCAGAVSHLANSLVSLVGQPANRGDRE